MVMSCCCSFLEKKKMKNPEGNNRSDPVDEFILLGFPCT